MSSELWDEEAVSAGLAGTRFEGGVKHFASLGSTQTLANEAAQAGEPEGRVWVADEQTAGRGRGGHAWHSVAGDGLYLSALTRPRLGLVEALWISLATGLAVQTAVYQVTGVRPDLRWPNDLLIGDGSSAGKKFGGILVETSSAAAGVGGTAEMLRYAIIGIGLNVGHKEFPEELRELATSLLLATGTVWPRESLLVALLRALDEELDRLEAELMPGSPGFGGSGNGGGLLVRGAGQGGPGRRGGGRG
jgi:BirA family biotin operon repressor/biotin-[acetyl-CoA-carboxylase] ligase